MPWVWTDELVARLDGAGIDPGRLTDWRARPVAVPVTEVPEGAEEILALPRVAGLLEEGPG